MRNFLQNYALNIWLIAFPWKLYQICDHRFNDFLAITEIHLHRNNMGFNKKCPFVASPGTETSHITVKIPGLHWDLCKGQANHNIALRITTIWICHIPIVMLFLWERVVYCSIQFSYMAVIQSTLPWFACLLHRSQWEALVCQPRNFYSDATRFSAWRGHKWEFFVKCYVIPM